MTFQSKYRENKRLLLGYVAFLAECTSNAQKLKLSAEIGRLHTQNQDIEIMEFATSKTEASLYQLKIPACL